MLRAIRTHTFVKNSRFFGAVMVLTLTALLGITPSNPAVAENSHTSKFNRYVAVGDSAAAAPLLGYLHEPGQLPAVTCVRGRVSYPINVRDHLVARGLLDKGTASFVNATCSAASTAAITEQVLSNVNENTDLVTLTGGALDLSKSDTELKNAVKHVLQTISGRASKTATIVATGYLLYTGGSPKGGSTWSHDKGACRADPFGGMFRTSADTRKAFQRLNTTIKEAVADFSKSSAKPEQRVRFADIAESPRNTEDRSACNQNDGAPVWSPLNTSSGPFSLIPADNDDAMPAHPTELASEEYARLVLETIPGIVAPDAAGKWRVQGPYGLQSKLDFAAPGGWLSGHQRAGVKLANPAKLRMHSYVPDGLTGKKPLVVALDGCGGMASNEAVIENSDLRRLADKKNFALLFPVQTVAGDPKKCFHWWETKTANPKNTNGEQRGVEEIKSIHDMVAHMLDRYDLDDKKVFVVGGSAGGAMTADLLAAYPEMFSAGSVLAGLPAGCVMPKSDNNPTQPRGDESRPEPNSAHGCMQSVVARYSSAKEWGNRAREIYRDYNKKEHKGEWPRVQIMHGEPDPIVSRSNADALESQWANLLGVETQPAQINKHLSQWGHLTYSKKYEKNNKVVLEVHRFPYRGHEVAGDFIFAAPEIFQFFGLID